MVCLGCHGVFRVSIGCFRVMVCVFRVISM